MDCECEKDIKTITKATEPLQQLPPCATTAAPASKQSPVVGSSVGVLYTCGKANPNSDFCTKCGTKVYCVHNGRLVKKTANYILVNHWKIGKNGNPQEETRIFYRKTGSPRLVSLKVTPDLPVTHPHYCAAERKPTVKEIVPPDAIGMEIPDATKAFGKDMKNGRYLYWQEKNGTFHCALNIPDSRLYRIYYAHFPKPKCGAGGGKPTLTAEFTCRDNVLWASKTSDKNLGAKAKC